MRIRDCRHFLNPLPLLGKDKGTVYQRHGFCDPDFRKHLCSGRFLTSMVGVDIASADRKRGQRKEATSQNVKNCQKVSKIYRHFSTLFAQGKKTSKIVKKCQEYFSAPFAQGQKRQKSSKSVKRAFRHFLTISGADQFSGPF